MSAIKTGKLPSVLMTVLMVVSATAAQSGDVGGPNTAAETPTSGSAPIYDVTAFGAVCDGRTDDTPAFNKAIAAASTSQGTMSVPGGRTCELTSMLTLPSNVRLVGAGPGDSILDFKTKPGVAAIMLNGVTNVEISGLGFSDSGEQLSRGIDIAGDSSKIRIEHNKFSGLGRGTTNRFATIFIGSGGAITSDILIESNEFTGNGNPDTNGEGEIVAGFYTGTQTRIFVRHNYIHDSYTRIAVGLFDTSDSQVTDNDIDGNNRTAGTKNDGYGVMFYRTGASVNFPARNVIARNNIRNTAGDGIYSAGSDDTLIEGNHIFNACQEDDDRTLTAGGIGVNGGTRVTVRENLIDTSAWHGIDFVPTASSTISGNIVRNVAKFGIRLRHGDDCNVVGNQIVNATAGIMAGGGAISRCTISGNTIGQYGGSGGGGIAVTVAANSWRVDHNVIERPRRAWCRDHIYQSR